MGVSELRKLRQLEEENQQLKKLVADLSRDKQMLQDDIKKSYNTHLQKGNGIV
jgi:putative transposase